jgi:hypothetical protein
LLSLLRATCCDLFGYCAVWARFDTGTTLSASIFIDYSQVVYDLNCFYGTRVYARPTTIAFILVYFYSHRTSTNLLAEKSLDVGQWYYHL